MISGKLWLTDKDMEKACNLLSANNFISLTEAHVLKTIFADFKLVQKKGYDPLHDIRYTNPTLARKAQLCPTTIGRTKVLLQARGIIELDGLTWEENYDFEKGRRRVFFNHNVITFSKQFIDWIAGGFKQSVRSLFSFCLPFVPIFKARKEKQAKYNQIIKDALKSFKARMKNEKNEKKEENKKAEDQIKTKDLELPVEETAAPKKPFVNPVMKLLSHKKKREVNNWTAAATNMVRNFLQGGVDVRKLAELLTQQNYAADVSHGLDLIKEHS